MFNQQPKNQFGSNVFGNTGSNIFGSKTTSGGLFGSSSGTGFGTTSTSAFGNNTLFGTPASKPAPNLFGTPASQGFGATSNNTFGSSFGANKTSGLFGATTATNSSFTSNTGGGLFGSSGGAFGQSVQNGTGAVKFTCVSGSDVVVKNGSQTNIQTRHQCITAMKDYESKSFEELHEDDRVAGRSKGGTGTSAFGSSSTANASSSFQFGNVQSASSNLFGGQKSTFGSAPTGGGLFGNTNTSNSSSLFSKSFGNNTATTTSAGFGFGATASTGGTSLFGKPAGGNMFGNTTTTTASSLFGNSASSTGFGSGFGSGGGSNLFGKPTAFGATTTSSTSAFGSGGFSGFGNAATAKSTANTGGLFGGSGFGNTNTGGSLFSSNTSKPAFGATGGTGLFSTNNTNQNKSLFSGFGNNAGTTSASNTLGGGFSGFGTSNNNTGGGLFGQQNANAGTAAAGPLNLPSAGTQQSAEILKSLLLSPFGDSPLFKNSIMDPADRRKEMLRPTNPAAQKAAVQSPVYRVSTMSSKPRATNKTMSSLSAQAKSHSLFAGLENEDDPIASLSRSFIPRSNVKKLNIKLTPNSHSSYMSSTNRAVFSPASSLPETPKENPTKQKNDVAAPAVQTTKEATPIGAKVSKACTVGELDDTMANLNVPRKPDTNQTPASLPSPPVSDPTIDKDDLASVQRRLALEEDDVATGDAAADAEVVEKHPSGIRLTPGNGYYTIPSIKELADLTDSDGKCIVEDFTIGRKDYGSVSYKGKIDVTGIDFDNVVQIRRKEVTIYPDDDSKPPLGEGLNRKAEITLVNVWPTDKSTREPVTDIQRLSLMGWDSKLEQVTLKMGARFLEYRPDTGTWVFQVNHFSKYGLGDSDDEVDEPAKPKTAAVAPADKIKAAMQKGDQAADKKTEEDGKKDDEENKNKAATVKKQLWSNEGTTPSVIMEIEEGVTESVTESDGADCRNMEDNFPSRVEMSTTPRNVPSQISFTSPRYQSLGINAEKLQDAKRTLFADFDDDDMPAGEVIKLAPSYSSRLTANPNVSLLNDSGASEKPYAFGSKQLSTSNLAQQPPQTNDRPFSPHIPSKSSVSGAKRTSSMLNTSTLNKTSRTKVQRSTASRINRVKLPVVSKPVRNPKIVVHLEDNEVVNDDEETSSSFSDLVLSKSFRIGWGPNWTLVHSTPQTNTKDVTSTNDQRLFNFSHMQQKSCSQFSVHVRQVSAAPHLFIPPAVLRNNNNDEQMQSSDDQEAVSATHACLPYLNCALMNSSIEENNSPQSNTDLTNTIISTTKLSNTTLDQTMVTQEPSCTSLLPLIIPMQGNGIVMEYAKIARDDWLKLNKEHSDSGMPHLRHSVFTLCDALWGNIQLDDGSELTCDNQAHLINNEHRQARKGALLAWLVDAIEADHVAGHTISGKNTSSAYQIFKLLIEGKIANAVQTALTTGNGRLAILLSQAIGDVAFRVAVAKQLVEWESMKIDEHISETMIKIYSLLAAKPMWVSSGGSFINTCDNLDWKRSLLTHMLFISEPVAPLDDGLKLYNQAWKGTGDYGIYCSAPLPFYEEKTRILKCMGEKEKSPLRDISYQIIRLYCNSTRRLEKLLTTASSLPHALDHRISWHVWRILHALGYKTQISARNLVEMHVAYASQLETSGLWHQAVFVLMHIVDNRERERRVRNLISRQIIYSTKEEEEFITEQLSVPVEWIHETRALNAKMYGDHMTLARELLLSGHWRLGHDTLILHIAADSLINGKHEDLKNLLLMVNDEERVRKIPDWSVAGKIYLDYFSLCSRIEDLKKGDVNSEDFDYHVELFEDDVSSLCRRVNEFKCRNSTDRLAKSEIAKGTFDLHMTLSSLKNGDDDNEYQYHRQLATGAESLERLQLPEDLALHGVIELAKTHYMSFD